MPLDFDDRFAAVGSFRSHHADAEREPGPDGRSKTGNPPTVLGRPSEADLTSVNEDPFDAIDGSLPEDLDRPRHPAKEPEIGPHRTSPGRSRSSSTWRTVSRPWVPRTAPLRIREHLDWEPAYSLVERLAARNGTRVASLASDYGLSLKGIQSGKRIDVERLAFLAGVDATKLSQGTMSVGGPAKVAKQLRGEIFNARYSERGRDVVCQGCLTEDRSADPLRIDGGIRRRVWWDLKPLHHCPQHRCRLVPSHAGAVPRGNDSEKAIGSDDCAWEGYVLGRLGFGDRMASDLLDELGIEAVFDLVAASGAVAVHGTDCWRTASDLLGDPAVMKAGFEAVRTKEAFLEALAALRTAALSGQRSRTPREMFGLIFDLLDKKRDGSLDAVASLMLIFVSINIPRASQQKVLGRPAKWTKVESGKYWDFGSTGHVQIARKRVIRVGRSLGLLESEGRRTVGSESEMPQTVVDAVLELLTSTVGPREIREELGLTDNQWQVLMNAHLIDPVHRLAGKGKERYRYAKDAGRLLLNRLAGCAPIVERGEAGWISVVDAAERRLSGLTIIEALLDGRLRAKCRLEGIHGLRSILVSLDDVRQLVKEINKPEGAISVDQFARRLGMDPNLVRRLIVHGAIRTVDGRSKKQRWIAEEEVERFDATFVQSTKLKQFLGMNKSTRGSTLYEKYGLECALPEVKHRLCFYRRSDLERAGLQIPAPFGN